MTETIESLVEGVDRILNGIVDPCSTAAGAPAGLVDMGLIRERSVEPDGTGWQVRVRLSVTHPFCMMAAVFINDVEKRLRAMREWTLIDVRLDSKTIWSPEMMTPAYAARLEDVRQRKGLTPA